MHQIEHTCSLTHGTHKRRTPAPFRQLVHGVFLAAAVAWGSSLSFSAYAQDTWRGMGVPNYPNAAEVSTSIDDDEYEIYFRSDDDAKAIFDFYRQHLEQQGFKVTKSKTRKRGYKADMTRGSGGPDDRIELDVKEKHGRYKVEIEFDD